MLLTVAPALFVVLWSSGFVAAKLAIPFAEPCTFLFLRFAIVVALVSPFALFSKAAWKTPAKLLHAMVAGGLMQGLYLSCVVWSIYLGMPAGVVALTVSLHPITTALLARIVLGDRISAIGWLGFVLGIVGAALVLWPKLDLDASGIRPATIALCLMALPAMSCGTIYQKRFATDIGVGAATSAQHLGALLVVGLGAVIFEQRVVEWMPVMIGSLAWQALAVSMGAVGLLLLMLRAHAASRAASVFYLIPAGSAVLTYAMLGEGLEHVQIAGVGVVTAAVLLINLGSSRDLAPADAKGRPSVGT